MSSKELPFYAMSSEELMALGEADLKDASQKDLSELSYFIWAFYSADTEMMDWRRKILFPLIVQSENEILPPEDWDG